MGEKRVDAGLCLGLIEEEFSLAVFLLHRVVVSDCDLCEGLAATGDTITKYNVVNAVSQPRQHNGG